VSDLSGLLELLVYVNGICVFIVISLLGMVVGDQVEATYPWSLFHWLVSGPWVRGGVRVPLLSLVRL